MFTSLFPKMNHMTHFLMKPKMETVVNQVENSEGYS